MGETSRLGSTIASFVGLTEVLFAGQISLKIGLTVAFLSTLLGTVVGAIAGFFGGFVDQALMRFTDFFLVVPQIALLAIALKKFGQTDTVIILVLAALGWMYVARVVRGQVLSIKEKEFVEAARAAGAPSSRIIIRHILPNCIGPILVNATLGIAAAIVTADKGLRPAAVGAAAHPLPDEVFNRRWFVRPGQMPLNPFGGIDLVKMNPGTSPDVLLQPAGPTDPDVSVLSVQDAKTRRPARLGRSVIDRFFHRERLD